MLRDIKHNHDAGPLQTTGSGPDAEVMSAHAFWRNVQRLDAGVCLRRVGKLAGAEKIGVISGWLCELTLLPDGRRQIFDFVLPHEIASLPTGEAARRDLIALTRVELIDWSVARQQMREGAARSWEQSEPQRHGRMFDQVIRLGRLTAEERMLHLFLDIYHRLKNAGLVQADTLKLPLTQELLADALGLSVVHINRTVKALRGKGYITLRSGMVTLHRPQQLAQLACYERAPGQMVPPRGMSAAAMSAFSLSGVSACTN
jgi:CRP-like cAMP-binding protein